jgi:DNA-directed RNA polymerase subunit delta
VRDLALTQFDGQDKAELSMIEVARAILSDRHESMAFSELLNEVQTFTGKSDEEIRARLAQFYTDLNIDGSFISLGDNMWALRSWYPIDAIDEAVHLDLDEEEGAPKKKKRKKINAFLAGVADDDDVIDYNDDDPEDDDFGNVADEDEDDEAAAADDADESDDDDDDDDDDFDDDDEVSAGIGEEIGGIASSVDDDYGDGDIEK